MPGFFDSHCATHSYIHIVSYFKAGMAKDSDKSLLPLIRLCKKGDRSAQFNLYRRFYRFGMGICLRYASSEEDAREIVNDAFFNIFTKLKQYDEQRTFVSWARKVFIHAAIDYLRKYKSNPSTEELEQVPESEFEPESINWMHADEIAQLIGQLPPQYRAVYNLYEIEGYKHEEIGKLLGISTGTSKSNLARARKKMELIVANYLKHNYPKYER
ncbi:MAG: RNA polymerase subunit sigma-70 [Saprospirales bacterium]|nr:RNA polymerase subunit sigma-70 [Saprospirales bacterium]